MWWKRWCRTVGPGHVVSPFRPISTTWRTPNVIAAVCCCATSAFTWHQIGTLEGTRTLRDSTLCQLRCPVVVSVPCWWALWPTLWLFRTAHSPSLPSPPCLLSVVLIAALGEHLATHTYFADHFDAPFFLRAPCHQSRESLRNALTLGPVRSVNPTRVA